VKKVSAFAKRRPNNRNKSSQGTGRDGIVHPKPAKVPVGKGWMDGYFGWAGNLSDPERRREAARGEEVPPI